MLFDKAIPELVLESPNTRKFVDVLNGLQKSKIRSMNEAMTSFNPALCCNIKWLQKMAADYGFEDIPDNYPIEPIQMLLLNVNVIRSLCGTKLGTELLVSTLTLGEVTIDESQFIRETSILFPDGLGGPPLEQVTNGTICDNNVGNIYSLCDSDEIYTNTPHLGVTVATKFHPANYHPYDDPDVDALLRSMMGYIEKILPKYIGFLGEGTVGLTFYHRDDYFYHSKLNPYFHG